MATGRGNWTKKTLRPAERTGTLVPDEKAKARFTRLRQTGKEEEVLDRTAEGAATIAEQGLRYVSDSSPGYTGKRTGTTFGYYDKDGKRITDAAIVRRIKSSASRQPTSRSHGQRSHPGDGSRREGASSIATIRNGGNCAIRTSMNTSSSSRPPCPHYGTGSPRT